MRSEAIETGGHCRVGGEQVARSRNRQGHVKGLAGFFHEIPGAFQHGESRMAFVEVTHFWLEAKRAKQPPSAKPKHKLLFQPNFRPATIELAGDPSVSWVVRRVIAVQQVKLHPADLDLPGAQPDRITGQGDLQPQPLAIRLAQWRDR